MKKELTYNEYLDVSPEVSKALENNQPIVALESTIISHGMPYPQNVETALQVEQIVRENGAVPATIAIINGRMKAGLSRKRLSFWVEKAIQSQKSVVGIFLLLWQQESMVQPPLHQR